MRNHPKCFKRHSKSTKKLQHIFKLIKKLRQSFKIIKTVSRVIQKPQENFQYHSTSQKDFKHNSKQLNLATQKHSIS